MAEFPTTMRPNPISPSQIKPCGLSQMDDSYEDQPNRVYTNNEYKTKCTVLNRKNSEKILKNFSTKLSETISSNYL